MLQFPERKYCFLRLDFNTASLIPILTLNFTDLFMNFCNVGGEGGLTFTNEIKQTTLGILFIMTNSFLNKLHAWQVHVFRYHSLGNQNW